jgi:hypothetical protein
LDFGGEHGEIDTDFGMNFGSGGRGVVVELAERGRGAKDKRGASAGLLVLRLGNIGKPALASSRISISFFVSSERIVFRSAPPP